MPLNIACAIYDEVGLVVVQLPRLLVEPTVIQRITTFFVLTL